MKNLRRSLSSTLALAAVAITGNAGAEPAGLTHLVLASQPANSLVGSLPPGRVRVPPAEEVVLDATVPSNSTIQWTKNGKPIAGATGTSYVIPLATTADSGAYNYTGGPTGSIGVTLNLDVVPAGNLANFSILVSVPPGGSSPAVGFVVAGSSSTSLLVRAVGPSLSAFGIANPVAAPQLQFFDSAGKPVQFPARVALAWDWPAIFSAVGAFPLTAAGDSFDVEPFAPGAYTVQVTDGKNLGGTVLFEAYQGASLLSLVLGPVGPVTVTTSSTP